MRYSVFTIKKTGMQPEQQRQREPHRVQDRSHHQRQKQHLVPHSTGHGSTGGMDREFEGLWMVPFAFVVPLNAP